MNNPEKTESKAPVGEAKLPLIDRTDLGLTVVILTISGILYWLTMDFEKVADLFAQDVPPEFFPRLLIWTIVILTLGLPFEHLLLKRRGQSLTKERADRIEPMAYFTAALLFAVVASILLLGTSLSMVAVCMALPLLWGERRLKAILLFAIILPLLVTLLFSVVLGVHFEPGIFNVNMR
ncbi:MAG: tripartite tricarboxylate transporter TctB family protein [Rhodospirillales bacterium]|nr:tripartite tricarboxylate transporter TctB family protein [Rhodospirillales bacterium]